MLESMYYEFFFIFPKERELFESFLLDATDLALEESSLEDLKAFDDKETIGFISQSSWRYFATHGPLKEDLKEKLPHLDHFVILRSEKDLNSSLIPALESFCLSLQENLQNEFDFFYLSRNLASKDWLEAYKQAILPVQCGKFYIHPSWHQKPSHIATDFSIMIDPALAFGSGHHESTSMCLELLSNLDLKHKNALDVGCGSGILSIALKKQGVSTLVACDTDSLAIEETLKNFSLNQISLSTQDEIICGSTQKIQGHFDIIVANIVADVIKSLYSEFVRLCNHTLILSGILETHLNSVLQIYYNGFEILEQQQRNEWVALKLLKKQSIN
ncbi:50S ribosomal protein L11 methyltransferase [Helicobacter acinonychis]|uniref:Ribosomal protein L11 methyltransferase n=1 Tax=Helicobacter acinonychis (strain Sheeba) TaxID=382638 RepID=PRMA_HELAH|nr:50S ribosomal protein L11 methyltransferase [Helicobacter acinonychis]Q17WN8.1 RecName: Full=Ribosomal protein L11 methyltransferase; Short=L11 Mtase [Helicobacter acinonychis str. Sheeba]CAJ99938.1 ribosomal protein L11 methyltransferase [Helicobacter acinonychis str. Sheeba]